MKHQTQTYAEGMDCHTVVECVSCHKRIHGNDYKSDQAWSNAVARFLNKECQDNKRLAGEASPQAAIEVTNN